MTFTPWRGSGRFPSLFSPATYGKHGTAPGRLAGTVHRLLQQGKWNRQDSRLAPRFNEVPCQNIPPEQHSSEEDGTWICFAFALTDHRSLLRYLWTSCQAPGRVSPDYSNSLSRTGYRFVYE